MRVLSADPWSNRRVTDLAVEAAVFAWRQGEVKVTGLDLGGANQVTDAGIRHLSELSNLEEVDLSGTKVTDDGLFALRELRRLKVVKLHSTEVTSVAVARHLTRLSNLEEVDLSGTKVTDDGLLKTPTLRVVALDRTAVTDAGIARLVEAVNLEALSLTFTKVTDASAPLIARLPIRKLGLEGTGLTDAGLEALKGMNLHTLAIGPTFSPNISCAGGMADGEVFQDRAKITDVGLEHLKGMKTLCVLGIQFTAPAVTPGAVKALSQALPATEIVYHRPGML